MLKSKQKESVSADNSVLPAFEDSLLKFSNSLIASTSAENDQILLWESATLAPLETFRSDKFFVSPNTLAINHSGFLLASHAQKTTMAVWRWDKTSQPILKSPIKEELSVLKMFANQLTNPLLQGQAMLACGTKRGTILIYQLSSGRLLAEI